MTGRLISAVCWRQCIFIHLENTLAWFDMILLCWTNRLVLTPLFGSRIKPPRPLWERALSGTVGVSPHWSLSPGLRRIWVFWKTRRARCLGNRGGDDLFLVREKHVRSLDTCGGACLTVKWACFLLRSSPSAAVTCWRVVLMRRNTNN